MEGTLAEDYDVFGSTIVFKRVFEDDLGHLARAGLIENGAVDRVVWLRILDGYGLPREAVTEAYEIAREIADAVTGSQLPSRPFFIETDSAPAFGFDYVAGQPLNRVLTRARDEAFPLQPDNSLLIVEKIALALATVETVEYSGKTLSHGFLHPGLIHLSNDGDVAVTGFGLGDALLGALSLPDAVPGVRAYLAPEVLGGEPPSQAADVYSLGAILFHLLTGTALPVSAADRGAALDAAHLAWDGEVLPTDIKKVLARALASASEDRFESASVFREELDHLLYGGAYSPTTFNLALFMDRLFRTEIETEELACEAEREIDVSVHLAPAPAKPEPTPEPESPAVEGPAPEAVSPPERSGGKGKLWTAVAAVVIIGVAAVVFWIGRQSGPQDPPPPPTPTAAEIAAQRQAQEDRLRTLTQEMVKEMMVEREEEIRQELVARQTRIEELQRRLQQSERRARTSSVAAAKEAETQKELMKEIEEEEKAQREQEEALENERQEALESAASEVRVAAAEIATGEVVAADTDQSTVFEEKTAPESPVLPTADPSPSPPPAAKATETPEITAVTVGQFFPSADADTLPVVIKSQALEWPRNAARSKGKGVVVVQLTVNASGGVDEVEVLRADHTGWGIPEAAVEAASGYRFKPGTKNGVAITTHSFVTWRYDFTDE
jgi:TonB family protein